ncbi:MAG TPA: CDP-diacylglycerol--glycerol-3-phosphate 3-phosphatidyltransferase [Phycisphaerae bacterium]|nr:CDP-diacylglycerol--glycerol-3-phosphate 3-phosphatidyltransferase [Phycisphaerae bacterium]HNU45643.1 CDP-diacylglycerol--glycerol-3-phosphate 3-phosphatidyltransferase [Phycisphaerae bacterium]
MKLNVPNQITIARLGVALVFFVLLAQYTQREPQGWILDVSAGLFILAAVTDVLDGYLARRFKQVTPLGRVLDPLADKVLVCGAFIILAGPGFVDADGHNVTRVQAWMVVVIVGRELLVTGLRGFNESVGRAFPAGLHGKIKMWVQSVAAPAILLLVAHEGTWFSPKLADGLCIALVWITVAATTLSMFQYLARSRFILEESMPS